MSFIATYLVKSQEWHLTHIRPAHSSILYTPKGRMDYPIHSWRWWPICH